MCWVWQKVQCQTTSKIMWLYRPQLLPRLPLECYGANSSKNNSQLGFRPQARVTSYKTIFVFDAKKACYWHFSKWSHFHSVYLNLNFEQTFLGWLIQRSKVNLVKKVAWCDFTIFYLKSPQGNSAWDQFNTKESIKRCTYEVNQNILLKDEKK